MQAGPPESICCDSPNTLSASRSPPQLKVMSRQTYLADIAHLMFVQQQMGGTWWLLFVIRSGWWVEGRKERERTKQDGQDGKIQMSGAVTGTGCWLFVHVSIMNAGLPLHLLFLAFCLSSGGTINLRFMAPTNFYLSAPLVARFSRCSHFCFTANQ